MFKILKYSLICLFVTFCFVPELQAASSVGIQVRAYVPKTHNNVPQGHISLFNNDNQGEKHKVELFSDISSDNTKPYTLKIDSQNGFKLINSEGGELSYSLSLDSENGSSPVDNLELSHDSFNEKSLFLTPKPLQKGQEGAGYSDTLTLSVKAH